jgi:hypothetical protein
MRKPLSAQCTISLPRYQMNSSYRPTRQGAFMVHERKIAARRGEPKSFDPRSIASTSSGFAKELPLSLMKLRPALQSAKKFSLSPGLV